MEKKKTEGEVKGEGRGEVGQERERALEKYQKQIKKTSGAHFWQSEHERQCVRDRIEEEGARHAGEKGKGEGVVE